MANNNLYNCTDDGTPNGNPFQGIILNTDGTVYGLTAAELPSGQYGNTPTEPGTQLVAECCDAYATALLSLPPSNELSNYSFMWDDATQQCRWSSPCNLDSGAYKLILSPEQNDGALFDVDENETCYLEVSFDYIIMFDCATLIDCAGEKCDVISILSGISLDTTIEMVTGQTSTPPIYFQSPNRLETVYSQTFFEVAPDFVTYLTNNTNTGFLLTGDCESTINCILNGLGENCNVVSADTFNSSWVHYSYVLTQSEVLTLIQNQRIKLGIQINGCSCNFSLLLDNIKINKVCTKVDKTNIVVNTSPGFELIREVDNKKSWVYTGASQNRQYDLLMRDTSYFTNHSKLVINTKEVEINLDGATAIECNVFDYFQHNDCILTDVLCTESATSIESGYTEVKIKNPGFIGSLASWTVSPAGWMWGGGDIAKFSKVPYSNLYQKALTVGKVYRIQLIMWNSPALINSVQISLDGMQSGIRVPTAYISPVYAIPGNATTTVILTANSQYLSIGAFDGGSGTYLYEVRVEEYFEKINTYCTESTTISDLLFTEMSAITNAQEFVNVMQTELIDVKDRKVLSAYPTLRFIYDAYNNPFDYGCDVDSRHYNYCMLSRFMDLVGSYWVDIIEQVVPATTIWGSTYVYRNTIFDQPKFKYKRGTLFYCPPTSDVCSVEYGKFIATSQIMVQTVIDNDYVAFTGTMTTMNTVIANWSKCISAYHNVWWAATSGTDCEVEIEAYYNAFVNSSLSILNSKWMTMRNAILGYTYTPNLLTDYLDSYDTAISANNQFITMIDSNCGEFTSAWCSIIGNDYTVDVTYGGVQSFTANCIVTEVQPDTCSGVYIKQVDDGSEFIGSVYIIKSGPGPRPPINPDVVIISETIPNNIES